MMRLSIFDWLEVALGVFVIGLGVYMFVSTSPDTALLRVLLHMAW